MIDMKTKKKQIIDQLKAVKAANRSDEIRMYGKPINFTNICRNKKKYTRKIKHKKSWGL
jgi:hypothetical protein